MELNFDWRGFQSMFYPKRRSALAINAVTAIQATHAPVYLVIDGDEIVSAYGDHEDLSDWLGATYAEMAAEMAHRELVVFDRKDVDRWMSEALPLPHFYDQLRFLAQKSAPQVVAKKGFLKSHQSIVLKPKMNLALPQNFLLAGLQTWWRRFLPANYGIFIRLTNEDGATVQEFLVIVRRGRIDQYHCPDLSSMGVERMRQPGEVARYLSEKNLVKVQAIVTTMGDWKEWNDSPNPWAKMSASLRAKRAKMAPGSWMLQTLIRLRGWGL